MSDLTIDQVPVHSTPLGELTCPKYMRNSELPSEEHTVTSNGNNDYECTCGETFSWWDQFHYIVAPLEGQ